MISVQGLMPQKREEQGFTVIELLIVIVVLIILSVLVITTYGGIQQKNRNLTRQNNLEAIHQQIEIYFNKQGHYPSRTDMNNSAWLAKNLKTLDPSLLIDPSNPSRSGQFVATAGAKSYAYDPTQIDGLSSCENKDSTCAKYTLTATYEGSVNGASKLIIPGTN
ncbi:MAG TPA: prepilin-type N-terminal cleavage/methylation domain-containing protein [Candidatus Dormibacteraeota bacterium]|nr:prepilin-type N-terminal cleavage/methylation domain-containing protein [Candidatus Dormibacteraeota bacterium]